jgi:hypothetical protein|tara:strand:+ start:238 stop:531 length:294 start_codon:yes stop_codon:yes gene_type:complete
VKRLSQKFLARIKWRYDQYYIGKSKQQRRDNAMKMAHNWTHEYKTGTPLEFIRDDILAKWDRADKIDAGEKPTYFAEKMPSFNTDAMAAMTEPKKEE